jgi:phosphoglycerol transferase
VITSDDIMRYQPDCVLAQNEFSSKLTPFPTLGLMWSPPAFFAEDPVRRRSILSLDGHLCGSRQIAQWIDDFTTGHGKRSVIYDGLMLPSTPDAVPAGLLPSQLAIMYVGVHWDGSRHGEIFRGLDGRVPLRLYGPPQAWADRGASYRGTIPFDGVSVVRAVRDAGIALCLHKAAHREANCPSTRLFEAAAGGALIITDDFEFPREWFRDSVLYIDTELPAPIVVEQIVSHVEWANRNPDAANRLAQRSNELFRQRLTLESMLTPLPHFVDRVRECRRMVVVEGSTEKPQPTVEYIVHIGSRPAATLARALDSLAAQTYQAIAVILVQLHPITGLDAVVEHYRSRFRWIRHIVAANNGNRSTALWAGLKAVTADFFGTLDGNDTLFPNHVASLMDHLERNSDDGLVYSGVIKVEDEPGHYVTAFQFNGPAGKVIEEQREIFCLEKEDFINLPPARDLTGHNFCICRQLLLDREVLSDPKIEVSEDVYFMGLMAGRTRVGFTGMATAAWHWRSTTNDNGMLSNSANASQASLARWQERLQNVGLSSRNELPLPSSQYDAVRAVTRDLS